MAEDFKVIGEFASVNYSSLPTDSLARQEQQRKFQEAQHALKFDSHFFTLAAICIWVAGILFLCIAIIWGLHLLLPVESRWLHDKEIQGLERILFSSVLLSLAGKYFKRFRVVDSTPRD